ncbi:MAG: redoxin domain-containing protein [Halobacteriales archaeon]
MDEHGIEFPLLRDPVQQVAEAYSVLHEEMDGSERVRKRSLFLIDANRTGQVRWVPDDYWVEWINGPLREMLDRIDERRS